MFSKITRMVPLGIAAAVFATTLLSTSTPAQAQPDNQPNKTQRAILAIARGEVGYKEDPKHKNVNKYTKWYGKGPIPWCGPFVDWVYMKAGHQMSVENPKGLDKAPEAVAIFKKRHQFGSVPSIGALVFYDKGKEPHHVGIVYSIDYTHHTITAIEGNTQPGGPKDAWQVAFRVRPMSMVYGYAYPIKEVQ